MMFRRSRRLSSQKEYESSDGEDEPLKRSQNIKNIIKDHSSMFKTSTIFINKLKKSKYKIVDDNESITDILAVLDKWEISKPKLIVSVTGGAGQFALPSRIKTAFKYGIAKIAESTDALIITGNLCSYIC